MACKVFILLFCYFLLLAGGVSVVSGFTPVTYPARVSSECGQYDPLQDEQFIKTLDQVHQQLGPPGCNPPKNRSCQDILHYFPSAPSGYYQITAPNGSLVQVYCDMEGTNCGGEGGWTRVAYVNMSQSGATCPQGLTQRNLSGLTLCGRMDGNYDPVPPYGGGCQSTVFSTLGLSYSQVCGQLRGYQLGTPSAFYSYYANSSNTTDGVYVDGVSITYSCAPRKHIWSYAVGTNLVFASGVEANCPCNDGNNNIAPPFVGSDYYCETGDNDDTCCDNDFLYSNDTLWDGQQCPGEEAPCCTHPNMPWFNKTLSETTTEDIELRLCEDQVVADEDTLVQVIELFVRQFVRNSC